MCLLRALPASGLLLLVFTASAAADVFCVGKDVCAGSRAASVQDAIDRAEANGVAPDRIELGIGTFAERDLVANQPVEIVGSGPQSVIAGPPAGDAAAAVVRLAHPASVLRSLSVTQVVQPGSAGRGVVIAGGVVDDVDVHAPQGIAGSGRIVRARVRAGSTAITATGPLQVEATLLQTGVGDSSGTDEVGLRALSAGADTVLRARHVTILGSGHALGRGLEAVATGDVPASARIDARDMVVCRYNSALRRAASAATSATIDIDWSAYVPGNEQQEGPGAIVQGPNSVNESPQFRDQNGGDLRLAGGSPLIDRGTPGPAVPGETDAFGRPRAVDGDRDGDARRDLGGVEYQGAPRVVGFSFAPPSPAVGEPVTFGASAVPGDESAIARYVWDLDGNGSFETDTGATPAAQHTYDRAGAVPLQVRAIADDGGFGQASLRIEVRSAAPPAQAPRVPLAVSGFRLERKRFRVGPTRTALRAARARRGTAFRFRLTTAARTRLTIARRGGRRVGVLRRNSGPGVNRVRFSGRLGKRKLRPGRYRARLVASAGAERAATRAISFRVVR
jgi:hypothetical protein